MNKKLEKFMADYTPLSDEELQKLLDALAKYAKNTEDTTEMQIELDEDTNIHLKQLAERFEVSEKEILLALIMHRFLK